MLRRNVLLGAGASLFALAGCQAMGTVSSPAELQAARADTSTSTIVGRMRWIENGEELEISQSIWGWSMSPRLRRLEDRRVYLPEIDPGGHFVWSLPVGTYMVDRINYRDPMTGNYFVVPKYAFKVPKAQAAYYVGTLRIDAVATRDFLGGIDGRVQYSVVDDWRNERAYLAQKFGPDLERFEKKLMIHDPRLPTSIENTPEAQVALALLGFL